MATFQYLDEGNSEAQDRLASSFLLAQTSPGLARTGVLSGLTVTQTTTASGSVLIAAGAAPVQASVGTGVALLVNDTLKTLDVFTANPMGGLPRNDVVAFDSVTKAIIAIIGTPNATPDDPTVPTTACALARLRHAASAATIPTAKIDSLIVPTLLWGTRPAPATGRVSGNVGPLVAATALVSAPTFVSDGVKKYKITATARTLEGTVVTDLFQMSIVEGNGPTAVVTPIVAFTNTSLGIYSSGVTVIATHVPAAGARQYFLQCERDSGTGTATVLGPIEIIVEQIT